MFQVPSRANVLCYGSPSLRQEAQSVANDEFYLLGGLLYQMAAAMERYRGSGISAPEIGVPRRFVLIRSDNGSLVEMVNPIVTRMYGKEKKAWEACLCVPPCGNGNFVPRLEIVEVEYATAWNPERRITREFYGTEAIVLQHELDHLDGAFFFDRVRPRPKNEVLKLFQSWRDQRNAKNDAGSRASVGA